MRRKPHLKNSLLREMYLEWRLFDFFWNEPGTFGGEFSRENLEIWNVTYEKSGAEVGTVFICRVLSDETFEGCFGLWDRRDGVLSLKTPAENDLEDRYEENHGGV